MSKPIFVIRRSSAPHKLDTAPLGTLCEVSQQNELSYYLQVCNEVESPKWELLKETSYDEAIAYVQEFMDP